MNLTISSENASICVTITGNGMKLRVDLDWRDSMDEMQVFIFYNRASIIDHAISRLICECPSQKILALKNDYNKQDMYQISIYPYIEDIDAD